MEVATSADGPGRGKECATFCALAGEDRKRLRR
jgi:hypothetical protein